jgi:DNA-binding transcriptional LysR family regulator
MELRHLRYFVAVAEELHFRRAAERLNISQPPLSQQIRLLELELGTELFERTNKRVALTQTGRLFLPEARAAITQAEWAAEVARKAERGELGELRIGFFPSAPLVPVFAGAIRAYREKHPRVSLVLDELESREQILAIAEERADIAIVRSIAAPILPAGIVRRLIIEEPLVVALRCDHPLSKRRVILMEYLADEPFVFYGDRMGIVLPQLVLELCRNAGYEPRVSQLANANTTLIGLVAAGLGVAVVPRALARLSHADVVIRPIKQGKATIAAWILWDTRRNSPLVDAFLRLI